MNKVYHFTLKRTRIQHAKLAIIAPSQAHAADRIQSAMNDGEDYNEMAWSDGENEGAIEVEEDPE